MNGLNGLRAIAAISVVLSHSGMVKPGQDYILRNGIGEYAVTIFFALSGFLITYLLMCEKQVATIDVKKFYMRRLLRIWPLYFAYLVIAVPIIYRPEWGGLLPWYLIFAANVPTMLRTTIPYLSHYWSLGTEEQFYFLWPWIIKSSKNVLKALLVFTVGFLFLKIVFRYIYFKSGDITLLYVLSVCRFECMSLGGIAAVLCFRQNSLFMKIATHAATGIFCWLCLLAMAFNRFHVTPLADQDLAAVVTIGLIMNLSFSKRPVVNLENRVFDFLGKLSYGIYIIHPLVTYFLRPIVDRMETSDLMKSVTMYTGTLSFTIALAWLSYVFFERRFIRLKDKFSRIKTQSGSTAPL